MCTHPTQLTIKMHCGYKTFVEYNNLFLQKQNCNEFCETQNVANYEQSEQSSPITLFVLKI